MNIVTISRQVGSYGDEIATTVAEQMGLKLVGRQELHKMAQACDPDYRDACVAYEAEHGPGFFERLFFDRPAQCSLFESMTFEQASRGDVVIVGRGAQIVLREFPGVFRLRVVAPVDIRVGRVMERTGLTRDGAIDFVRRYDLERDSLIRAVFASNPDDWEFYDLILNTAHYTCQGAAQLVVEAVTARTRVSEPQDLQEGLRNLSVAKRIETSIHRKMGFAVSRHMQIAVEAGGVVRITGRVSDPSDKEKAAVIAAEHPGVSRVENELTVVELLGW